MRAITTTTGRLRRVSLILIAIILGISTFAAFMPTSTTKAVTQWETDGWDSISAADTNGCGVSNGHAYCWGMNDYGQLGNSTKPVGSSTNNDSIVPIEVERTGALAGLTIKSVSSGYGSNTCVIASDDHAYCWGKNNSGQLGTVSTADSTVPVAVYTGGVLNGVSLKSISTALGYTCALSTTDNLYCWGDYQATGGDVSDPDKRVPANMQVGGLAGKTVKQVKIGGNHTCALGSDDKVYCWGSNSDGVLGIGSTGGLHPTPEAVSTSGGLAGKTVVSISSTCALTSDDGVYCWGYAPGNGTAGPVSSPVSISRGGALSGLTIESLGDNRCVIASDGKAYCWGYMPGDGTTSANAPVAIDTTGVLSGKTIEKLSVDDGNHRCVITTEQKGYCWGTNSRGQLANGLHADSTVPVAIVAEIPAPVINSVSFSTIDTKRLLIATGVTFPELSGANIETLVKLNGSYLPMCTMGGLSAQDVSDGFGIPIELVSETPTCYQYLNDTMDGLLYTSTELRVWIPNGFDEGAEGTIQIEGGSVFTFNESSTPPTDPEITAVIDNSNPSSTPTVSNLPTFSGKAPAGSEVTVVVHSDPVSCTTIADGGDNWSCTLTTALPAGAHTVNITIDTPSDGTFNLGPYAIVVAAAESAPNSGTKSSTTTTRQVAVTDAQDTPTVKDPDPTIDLDDSKVTPIDDETNEPVTSKAEFPWVWLGVAVGAVALIIAAIVAARRNMQS